MSNNDLQKYRELARRFSTAMLVTVDEAGALNARPMTVARVGDDGSLWFLTSRDATAVDEVLSFDHASVEMQSATLYMHAYGKARVYLDREHVQSLWSDLMRPWFPDGPESDELCAVQLSPKHADWWDMRGTKALRFAFEAAKAVVTGSEIPAKAAGDRGHASLDA